MSERKKLSACPTLLKQWDYEKNGDMSPLLLTAGSGYLAWWKCEKGHSWRASVNHRTHGTGCPYCAGHIVIKGENDLKTVNPALASQWNYEKNGDLTPEDVRPGSHEKVWWRCNKGHEWQALIASRNEGYGCPYCAGQKPIQGETDFSTVHPELSKEWDYERNAGLTPHDICYGSNKKYWWKCSKGHRWQAIAGSRKRSGCPVCAGKKVLAGYNDLKTTYPELAKQWDYEKNTLLPSQVTAGSSKAVWWKCSNGHSWKAKIANRKHGKGCPYCSGRLVISGTNDLATLNPELAKEWDYERNYPLKPDQVMANAAKKVWWRCNKGHVWKAKIQPRNRGHGCLYCSGQIVIKGENDLQTIYPTLAAQWDHEKNRLRPDEVHSRSNQYAWWKCEKGHSWKAKISNRAFGRGCPYCGGKLVITGVNDLATINPELSKQWDYSKNGDKKPETVMANAGFKAWWICEKGHSWQSKVKTRNSKKSGCPYCSGLKAINGETDLPTVNPRLATEWDYERNTVDIRCVTFKSNMKVWWKCEKGHTWKATVCNRTIGKGCPYCAGKIPYKARSVR